MRDFPFTHPARGWYRLAWSADVTNERLHTTQYFGEEQISFRSVDGVAHVLDAYCQHLGAHLGFGGRIEGDSVVCPFHGWAWDGNGRNTDIPYATRTSARCITSWEVREIAGICLVWYDVDGAPPQWEPDPIPEANDGRHHPIVPHAVKVWEGLTVHPQALVENLGDAADVKYVHLSKSVPDSGYEIDGHKYRGTFEYLFGEGRASTWLSPNGPVSVKLDTEAHGIGYTISRYGGLHGAVHLLGATPIDETRSDMWAAALVPITDDDDAEGLSPLNRRLVSEMFKSHLQDLPIWENMRYIEHPPYAHGEARAHAALRKWAKQFYLPRDAAEATV